MDLKFAVRSLLKSPGFALIAVAVLALGIGANSAIFSVVNAVLLKPLPYKDPDRIVSLWSLHRPHNTLSFVSAPDFHDWRSQSDVFDAIAYYSGRETTVLAGAEPEQTQACQVTDGFFRVMGIEPVLGRLPAPRDDTHTIAISHAFWQRHFGGEAQVLGRSVKLHDAVFTVVGVLPPGFHFPDQTDLWFPANKLFKETTSRTAHNYMVVARLKPGATLEQAQAQMTAIASRLEEQYPENVNKSAAVVPLRDQLVRNVRSTLYLLLGAVGFVLLIACANVANLLLAKATGRLREIAIRAAVGASRARIVRQLITESAVLALAAGAVGLLLALWGTELLIALAPANVPRLNQARLDGWVLAFTMAMSLAASVLFGLAPALQASKTDLNDSLKQGGTRAGSRRPADRSGP